MNWSVENSIAVVVANGTINPVLSSTQTIAVGGLIEVVYTLRINGVSCVGSAFKNFAGSGITPPPTTTTVAPTTTTTVAPTTTTTVAPTTTTTVAPTTTTTTINNNPVIILFPNPFLSNGVQTFNGNGTVNTTKMQISGVGVVISDILTYAPAGTTTKYKIDNGVPFNAPLTNYSFHALQSGLVFNVTKLIFDGGGNIIETYTQTIKLGGTIQI
jgi:hypothetical protein